MVSTRAEIITRRTYNREKDDGTFETWAETIDRVIEHQKWLWERALTHNILPSMPLHDVTTDMREWVTLNTEQLLELGELRTLFLSRKALPSGRTLWLGNTEVSRRRESSMFNCAYTDVQTVYDVVDCFWLLLQGCGVGFAPVDGTLTGFRKPIKNLEIIRSERTGKGGKESNEETFFGGVWTLTIGDSAESWAKSIGKLLAGKYDAHTLVIDFSNIRPAGQRLKGYGWISSGDEPISKAYPQIFSILNRRSGSILSKIDIIEIINLLGTVLSSRRSAEIALFDYDATGWEDFATMKSDCYEPGKQHKQQSNNSLKFNKKPSVVELTKVFDMMIASGGSEPGFVNMQTAIERAPWVKGFNPCVEILLGSKSFCNLVEIDLSRFKGDSSGLHKAAELVARANYRQTIVDFRDGVLQEAWHLNNEFLRLCGVGITGIATRPDLSQYDWKDLRYSAVSGARGIAKELGLQHPKNVTTVKPSGSLSKIMDTTEGIHKPEGKYLFNWVNFSVNDPLVIKMIEAGYKWEINPTDDSNVIVCLPVSFDNVEFTTKEVTRKDGTVELLEVTLESAVEQLNRYKMVQVHYCDQNVSNTIYYRAEERDDIVAWLLANWDIYVGVSFLFKNDPTVSAADLGFNYLPQEYVTKSKFLEYKDSLREIDFNNTDSKEEISSQECAGGSCPVK